LVCIAEQVIKYHLQAIDELSLPDDSLMDDVEHLNHTEIPLASKLSRLGRLLQFSR